ncbi:hypothetical protein UFOVP582_43 [uncultured Caudovirales phage]|uniref:Uncharacterized protein n=1 Tax=uncultured Caudovirales phage TaxID=2100421 RepID=A0A6J7XCR3_9CAUD|nr:hypothetical protein UFOVP582_43 [uncultured Caudovirales phage]CAB4183821.1 hypothetical protein UFOVP1099_11 [uncultured Caudovirales phage]CAB4214116.1 hypothetical protein UFOVP1460_16 [uncultured Caudovirales phage]CAB5228611.1 hypothetical protein UFOVP1548_13 [uncultured Caudovirales phage]
MKSQNEIPTPAQLEEIAKQLHGHGLDPESIKGVLAGLIKDAGEVGSKVVNKVEDVAGEVKNLFVKEPKSVKPTLVAEGKSLPKGEKPDWHDVMHNTEDTTGQVNDVKYSDVMSKEEFDMMNSKDVKTFKNRAIHQYNTQKLTDNAREVRNAERLANKEKHAMTRTPEARASAAAKRKEYLDMLKKKGQK